MSVEAAKQAAEQLEAVRHRLEAERADQEDKMKSEKEGIIMYLHSNTLYAYCIVSWTIISAHSQVSAHAPNLKGSM